MMYKTNINNKFQAIFISSNVTLGLIFLRKTVQCLAFRVNIDELSLQTISYHSYLEEENKKKLYNGNEQTKQAMIALQGMAEKGLCLN